MTFQQMNSVRPVSRNHCLLLFLGSTCMYDTSVRARVLFERRRRQLYDDDDDDDESAE